MPIPFPITFWTTGSATVRPGTSLFADTLALFETSGVTVTSTTVDITVNSFSTMALTESAFSVAKTDTRPAAPSLYHIQNASQCGAGSGEYSVTLFWTNTSTTHYLALQRSPDNTEDSWTQWFYFIEPGTTQITDGTLESPSVSRQGMNYYRMIYTDGFGNPVSQPSNVLAMNLTDPCDLGGGETLPPP